MRYKFDSENPLDLTSEQWDRLYRMTPKEIEAAALSDSDNPPMKYAEVAQAFGPKSLGYLRTAPTSARPLRQAPRH